jgi:hypothetical protein
VVDVYTLNSLSTLLLPMFLPFSSPPLHFSSNLCAMGVVVVVAATQVRGARAGSIKKLYQIIIPASAPAPSTPTPHSHTTAHSQHKEAFEFTTPPASSSGGAGVGLSSQTPPPLHHQSSTGSQAGAGVGPTIHKLFASPWQLPGRREQRVAVTCACFTHSLVHCFCLCVLFLCCVLQCASLVLWTH